MKNVKWIFFSSFVFALPIIATSFVLPQKANAATITVSTTADEDADPGPDTGCSLSEAIIAANTNTAYGGCVSGSGSDVINVPSGTYELTTNPPGTLTEPTQLLGDDDGGTIIRTSISIDADVNGVFLVRNITVRTTTDSGFYIIGSGDGYVVTLDRVTSEGNPNLGVYHERYTYVSSGELRITNSLIQNNDFGGVYNNECVAVGTMYITNTMVINNGDTGVSNGCGHIVMDRVTIAGNTSEDYAGGVYNGGWADDENRVDLTNVTIFNNMSTNSVGGLYSGGMAALTNVTIANNTGSGVGGISGFQGFEVHNVLVANNDGDQCEVGFDDLLNDGDNTASNNMATDDTCSQNIDDFFEQVSDAKLASSLADNGGSAAIGSGGLDGNVLTLALLSGSPAIDAGNDEFCPATDERNANRPDGNSCDIGAYESPFSSASASGNADDDLLIDTGTSATVLITISSLSTLIGLTILARQLRRNY